MDNIITIKFNSCYQCPHHKEETDPYPDDWFRDSDIKITCKKIKENGLYKTVVSGLTVFEINKPEESPIPDWCPMIEKTETSPE